MPSLVLAVPLASWVHDGPSSSGCWTGLRPFKFQTGVLPGGLQAPQLSGGFILVFAGPLEHISVFPLSVGEPGVDFKGVAHRLIPFAFIASAASAPCEASAEMGFVDWANHGHLRFGVGVDGFANNGFRLGVGFP